MTKPKRSARKPVKLTNADIEKIRSAPGLAQHKGYQIVIGGVGTICNPPKVRQVWVCPPDCEACMAEVVRAKGKQK